MSLQVLILKSVGSCIDKGGVVYPLNVNGTPNTDNGVHWLDTTDEWNESLSKADVDRLNKWLLKNNIKKEK